MLADRAMMWLAQTTARPSGGPSRLYTPSTPNVDAGAVAAAVDAASNALPGAVLSTGSTPPAAVTPEQIVEAARLSPSMALALIAVSLMITAGVLWGAFWWWRVKNEPPADVAFRLLARRLRLSPAERSAIQRTASRTPGVPGIALLVCPSAMGAALAASRADPAGSLPRAG